MRCPSDSRGRGKVGQMRTRVKLYRIHHKFVLIDAETPEPILYTG